MLFRSTLLASRFVQWVSGPLSSCVWNLRVFPEDARGPGWAARGKDWAKASTQDLGSRSRLEPCRQSPSPVRQPPSAWGPTCSQELGSRAGTGQAWAGSVKSWGSAMPQLVTHSLACGRLKRSRGWTDRHLGTCSPHHLAVSWLSSPLV